MFGDNTAYNQELKAWRVDDFGGPFKSLRADEEVAAKGVPDMVQWIYRIVIAKLDRAKRLISAEGLGETPAFAGFVSTDDMIARSGVWVWLAKRAMRSESKRWMGLV